MNLPALVGTRQRALSGPHRRSLLSAYVALTKPRIIELLLVTTVPTMFVAKGGVPSLRLIAVTLLGGALAAGGANAVNMVVEVNPRDIAQIEGDKRFNLYPYNALSYAFIAHNMGLPRVVAALNTEFVHAWGQGGYLTPPTAGFPPPRPPITAESLVNNPVGGLSLSVRRLNNCAQPVLVNPAQL